MRHVRLENSALSMTILLDKGADIIEIRHKKTDIDFLWRAPLQLTEFPKIIPTSPGVLGNNLDYYEGGWHECLPGGGPYGEGGAREGIHGEVALLPWEMRVEKDDSAEIEIKISCTLIRYPFRLEKSIRLIEGEMKIRFQERFINLSGESLPYMWGHHPVFGKPFLTGDCRLDTRATRFENSGTFGSLYSAFEPGESGTWPVHKGRDFSVLGHEKSAEMLYLSGFDEGWYALTNPAMQLGIALRFDCAVFPVIWVWKVFNGLSGWPWYGMTYNIGVEFWSGGPDYNTCKQSGTLKTIQSNETIETEYTASVYEGLERVSYVDKDANVI